MNFLKRWIVKHEAQKVVDNAIKESHMSAPMKAWLVGLANAGISSLASALASVAAGATMKQTAMIAGTALVVSAVKWIAQHPIPAPEDPQPKPAPIPIKEK